MFNPDKIQYDTVVQVALPRLISVRDYHEFNDIKNFMKNELGIDNVEVDEVGFHDFMYVGLIHIKSPAHQKLVTDLIKYYDLKKGINEND